MLPELADFPSVPTPQGDGRIYDVWKRLRCVAYHIPDGTTLRTPGGFLVWVFIEGRRIGTWNWGDAADLERAIRIARTGSDPDAPRPEPRAPGGERPHIAPPFFRVIEIELEPRPRLLKDDPPSPEG